MTGKAERRNAAVERALDNGKLRNATYEEYVEYGELAAPEDKDEKLDDDGTK